MMTEEMAGSYSAWAVPSLRTIRWSKTLTQTDLAKRSGVSRTTIVRLEAGELAYAGTIRKLAKALGVSVNALQAEPQDG
ncbi:MAG TPA: helix-turn-helix transcriptional regulator [Chloroflexota bacterium]|jgi:DNA-binding XRE family transcriptional regulator